MHEDAESLGSSRPYTRWQNYLAVAGKRRFIAAISFAVVAALLGFTFLRSSWSDEHTVIPVTEGVVEDVVKPPKTVNSSVVVDRLGPGANLLGVPTAHFRGMIVQHISHALPLMSAQIIYEMIANISHPGFQQAGVRESHSSSSSPD
ncbi:hypothetical protein H0H87_012415 [Tephrocybe sp. NHM501043]|nr:hypothetical protein H0H87_012415 [Tephrocybe sp. NHM501043]